MNLDLTGKKALVGGSTQGIGKAAAIELALLGASVTLLARNEEKLKATVKELSTKAGQHHDYLVADFNSPETLKSVVEKFTSKNTVHILINNTGGPPGGLHLERHWMNSARRSQVICSADKFLCRPLRRE